jgi:hypothetical protein
VHEFEDKDVEPVKRRKSKSERNIKVVVKDDDSRPASKSTRSLSRTKK